MKKSHKKWQTSEKKSFKFVIKSKKKWQTGTKKSQTCEKCHKKWQTSEKKSQTCERKSQIREKKVTN